MNRYITLAIIMALLSWNCSSSPRYTTGTGSAKGKGEGKVKKRHPRIITGISSFYGQDFHGKLTANGEVFDMYGLTAAHKTLPLNTIIRVTNLGNNRSLILRINDRGPYVKGRILDCSYGAALKLGFVGQGMAKVRIEIIELGDNQYMKHKE